MIFTNSLSENCGFKILDYLVELKIVYFGIKKKLGTDYGTIFSSFKAGYN